jgi:hypothetical protein
MCGAAILNISQPRHKQARVRPEGDVAGGVLWGCGREEQDVPLEVVRLSREVLIHEILIID